jgi:hypothetical protein
MAPCKPINPTGFNCVNILMRRVISTVKKKARRRHAYKCAEVKPYAKLKPESKARVLETANLKAKLRKERDSEKKKRDDAISYKKHAAKRELQKKEYRNSEHGKSTRSQHLKTHPELLVHARLRRRMHTALSNTNDRKAAGTLSLLGCSRKQFVAYLSRMLIVGNTLNDEEIDHIFPMDSYEFASDQDQYRCSNYTNMQPLTSAENRYKSAKLHTKAMAAKVDPACWPDGITEDMLPDIYPGWRTPLRM